MIAPACFYKKVEIYGRGTRPGIVHAKRGTSNTAPGLVFKHFFIFSLIYSILSTTCMATGLTDSGLYVIPYPQKVIIGGNNFNFDNSLNIVLDKNHSAADEFAANELIRDLKNEWNINAAISNKRGSYSIVLSRQKSSSKAVNKATKFQ